LFKDYELYNFDMNVRAITDTLFPIIEKHRNDEHVELEFRLGKFNGTMSKYNGWDKIIGSEQEVFYRDSDGLRISTDRASGDEEIIKKERILNQDFKQSSNVPFDIRCSVSKEIPMPEDIDREMDKKKVKQRVSFLRKNVSIDITIVTGDTHDMDAEDPMTYQIEFEIINPSAVVSKDDLFKILYKINNVFIMLNNTR
jgi:hypothetical protein